MKLKDCWEVLMKDIFWNLIAILKMVKMVVCKGRYYHGSVRIAAGRIWIDEGYEKRRKRILETPLP